MYTIYIKFPYSFFRKEIIITKEEKRIEYFKKQENPDRIIETYNTKDFLELVCRYGGDTVTFRVYEDNEEPDGFYIVER